MKIISRDFYMRPAPVAAPELLGCLLVRELNGVRLSGMITEVEAYQGMDDQACHARRGCTERCKVMFGDAGHAYIYFTYGMHWMLNLVCEPAGVPAAVLIRAVVPVEGIEEMARLRPMLAGKPNWLNGPAKLTKAFALDRSMNGADLCDGKNGLWVEEGRPVLKQNIRTTPRIGINYAPEPWLSMPWRWQAEIEDKHSRVFGICDNLG